MKLAARFDDREFVIEVERESTGYRVKLDGAEYLVDVVCPAPQLYSLIVGGKVYELLISENGRSWRVELGGRVFELELDDFYRRKRRTIEPDAQGKRAVVAQMPGKIVRTLVAAGDEVAINQGLMVIEAMKMQNEIRAPRSGRVVELPVRAGQTVNAGDLLAVIA